MQLTPAIDGARPAETSPVVVIGAGPAGLTAALQLRRAGRAVVVAESSDVVGGISRTVEREGWRFDIGGHRFFTKVPQVDQLWRDILPEEEFLTRPRMSRIYYGGKLYDYPLRASNALRNLGPVEAARCVLSYIGARLRPPADQTNFEGWVAARFGWRLYRTFFKTYTEKIWGVDATEIQADWASQRIKNLSLGRAIVNSVTSRWQKTTITTLIEEFRYPKYGPGQMWEAATQQVEALGGEVRLNSPVVQINRSENGADSVWVRSADGIESIECSNVISSMPLGQLVRAMQPGPPPEVTEAADCLRYRDFLTVALVVGAESSFPDNWIYIHDRSVSVGRIQNFGSWSPFMVKDGRTCLGLEYFVAEGDEVWSADDDVLIRRATDELSKLDLVPPSAVEAGYVVRVPKAYPVYDDTYKENVDILRSWLEQAVPNVFPVGRNGMHRYNNSDHSMLTAMLSVENICGAEPPHDIWAVNVDEEYHEEVRTPNAPPPAKERRPAAAVGTGRLAPVIRKGAARPAALGAAAQSPR
jgi:protoporphyrinogen oxidase